MKKLIGSIIIMLILSQPASASTKCTPTVKTISVHIYHEYKDYKDYAKLDIIRRNENLSEKEEQPTIEDLSDNMNLVTDLLKVKQETISNVKNAMSQKAKNRETMSEDQINRFQEFIKLTQEKSVELQSVLQQIDSKKSLKQMQNAIFQNNIDYAALSDEISSIQRLQEIAISDLTNIISSGNGILEIL